jgi:CRP-like cAMP-binding protein
MSTPRTPGDTPGDTLSHTPGGTPGAVPSLAPAPGPAAPSGDGNGAGPHASDSEARHRFTTTNRLLAALPPDDVAWFAPHLERVELEIGHVLAAPGEPFAHVYFPETAIASVVNRMADGAGVEVGTIGNEGMVGMAAYLDAEASEAETFIQLPGPALRVPAGVITEAAGRPGVRRLFNRYTQAYMTQVAQGAACNRLHHLEARCARWLLMTHDRVGGADSFPLKQEFLALMLGVRRTGVSLAAGSLQDAGLIRYRRASIRVLDRAGLEAASCECYGIVRRTFDRLLP